MGESIPPRPQSGTQKNYFGKEMLVLKLFGVSLTGTEGTTYKIYSFIFVFLTIVIYPILDFCEYFKHDVIGAADIVIYQTGGIMAFCKAAVVFRNRVGLVKLLAKLQQEPFLPNPKRGGDKEKEIIMECIWITNAQTYTYWILTSATVIVTIIYGFTKHITNDDYSKFPYGPFNVLNVTYSPNYEITYFYQSFSMVFIGALFTSVDLLLAAVLAHICYQFKMLQNNIRCLIKLSYEEMMEDASNFEVRSLPNPSSYCEIDGSIIPWRYLQKSIKKVIKYHMAIIDIAAEIEKVFSNLLLLVFLGTLALLCFSVYGASVVESDPQLLARHLIECMCAILQVATICYWGEQVMQESELIGRAVSESNFVGTDLRFQKMLAFVIRRSQNPTMITAGKFAKICLTTFTWILRTSYSSFMVLRKSNAK